MKCLVKVNDPAFDEAALVGLEVVAVRRARRRRFADTRAQQPGATLVRQQSTDALSMRHTAVRAVAVASAVVAGRRHARPQVERVSPVARLDGVSSSESQNGSTLLSRVRIGAVGEAARLAAYQALVDQELTLAHERTVARCVCRRRRRRRRVGASGK